MTTLSDYLFLPGHHRHRVYVTHALCLSGGMLAFASACSFDAPSVPGAGGGSVPTIDSGPSGSVDATPPPDGPPEPVVDVAHVPAGGEFAGTMDLVWDRDVLINTTSLTIGGMTYPGQAGTAMVFDAWPQDGGGPELAVLHVSALTILENVSVRVIGSRPLVIVAGGEIDLAGVINASASGAAPGAGGAEPGQGSGAGSSGTNAGEADSGGSGAGHREPGGNGGLGCNDNVSAELSCMPDFAVEGAAGGPEYGDVAITTLTGGSGGGEGNVVSGSTCLPGAGGAGGGAVQLFSRMAITIRSTGGIRAGGGGGGGGNSAPCTAASSGGGGGSGGAIYLQAPAITQEGILAANGGGGGSGGGTELNGEDGEDGVFGAAAAAGGSLDAPGGTQNGSIPGGAGGTGDVSPEPGGTEVQESNGGGGGGAAGYIVIRTGRLGGSGTSSPAAHMIND